MFALTSLLSREIYHQLWPATFFDLALQLLVFTLFYETYSYGIHRLMHTSWFIKFHGVHHWSMRVTPWSAYSVHLVEAIFIGISAPLFMLVFPLDLAVVLSFHIAGMMFTILLHSNFTFNISNSAFKKINQFSRYHRTHHLSGKVNFGFINSFWDRCFHTKGN